VPSRDASAAAVIQFRNLDALIITQGINGKEITAIRTRYRTTHTRHVLVEEEVSQFEVEHGYEVRWTTASKEYNDALVLTNERCYRRALDKLKRLVVQRLLELTKLSMIGVGECFIIIRHSLMADICLYQHTNCVTR
jgi:hypothetical protein